MNFCDFIFCFCDAFEAGGAAVDVIAAVTIYKLRFGNVPIIEFFINMRNGAINHNVGLN